jgi:hypothetical protein
MYAHLGPHGSKTTTSAVSARGTVEMLSAPEWVKVSTDRPSQLYSLCLPDKYGNIPSNSLTGKKMTTSRVIDPPALRSALDKCRMGFRC